MFSIGYHGRLVEALLEHIYDQGPRYIMVSADPTVDVSQQLLPLFDGDAALQDSSVALLVELTLNNNEGLGTMRELLGLRFVRW